MNSFRKATPPQNRQLNSDSTLGSRVEKETKKEAKKKEKNKKKRNENKRKKKEKKKNKEKKKKKKKKRPCYGGQLHMETLIIYKLVFHQNYYTFT